MRKLLMILLLLPCTGMAQKLIIKEKVKLLALGDSYTIGESVPKRERWPEQFIDSLNQWGIECFDPKVIATTGWRTDDLMGAIEHAKLKPEYSLVSLLIGVNNFYQGRPAAEYAPDFEALLNTAVHLAGGNKEHVLVISIPDYGYTPFGQEKQQEISDGINAFNAINASLSEKAGVKYFNITDISRQGLDDPDLVASDGLHPSGKMYAAWVRRILDGAVVEGTRDVQANKDDNKR